MAHLGVRRVVLIAISEASAAAGVEMKETAGHPSRGTEAPRRDGLVSWPADNDLTRRPEDRAPGLLIKLKFP